VAAGRRWHYQIVVATRAHLGDHAEGSAPGRTFFWSGSRSGVWGTRIVVHTVRMSAPEPPPSPGTVARAGAGLARLRAISSARRVCAVLILVVVALALPVALVATWNPWRFVRLMPVGGPLYVGIACAAAAVLVGVAGGLAIRRRAMAWIVAVSAPLLGVVACLCGGTSVLFSSRPIPTGESTIVAVSADGTRELVALEHGEGLDDFSTMIRIRSRNGVWSRESPRDVACFSNHMPPGAGGFVSARFVEPNGVEVRADDGTVWTTTFDQHTLVPAQTLRRSDCARA
jgi:hypothetical protein